VNRILQFLIFFLIFSGEKLKAEALSQEVADQITLASQNGFAGLKAFQKLPNSEAEALYPQIQLIDTNKGDFSVEVRLQGELIANVKRDMIGAGNNVNVYATDRGTVLKVVQEAKEARKNQLLAWSEQIVEGYGIEVAHVLNIHPSGIYLEQEHIKGESLEYLYGFSKQGIPDDIRAQVVDQWEKAKELAAETNIWLDFKSQNYHLRPDGRICNVDYVPRLNKTFKRYFEKKPGKPFTASELVDKFFYRNIKDEKPAKIPPESERESGPRDTNGLALIHERDAQRRLSRTCPSLRKIP
jgi:hypothetical protein